MKKGFMKTSIFRVVLPVLTACFLFAFNGYADPSRYKELLPGDRAATMGGAYSAIADEATGAYYNPAGLIFGADDSMTSISNATNFVRRSIDGSVPGETEEMEGWRYLINYVGYMKRMDDMIVGLSYAIDDSTETYENEEFSNGLIVNRKGDDRTYKYGPSLAFETAGGLALGATLYIYQREYYMQTNRIYNDGGANERWTFDSVEGHEIGGNLILGAQWQALDKVSMSLVLKKTKLLYSREYSQYAEKGDSSTDINYSSSFVTRDLRKTPLSTTLGMAWFPNPYFILSVDLDYYLIDDTNKEDVFNVSMGAEYFLNEKHVIRAGLFTNNDNDTDPDNTTTKLENVDMMGASLGYSIYNASSVITIGGVWQFGNGKTQANPDDPTTTQDVFRESYSYILAVSLTLD